jgi:hypothetical protein
MKALQVKDTIDAKGMLRSSVLQSGHVDELAERRNGAAQPGVLSQRPRK